MGQLWELFSDQCTACILPLLYSLFLLPSSSTSSFYVCLSPRCPIPNFLSLADTIALVPAAVAIFFLPTRYTLCRCVWTKEEESEEEVLEKSFRTAESSAIFTKRAVQMNKESHCLIFTIVSALNSKNHDSAFSFILVLWVPFSCAGNWRAARLGP